MGVAPGAEHAADHHLRRRKTLAEHVHERDGATLADGAAGGAEVGAVTGDWGWAAGGAAIGAAGGYLYDQQKQGEQRAYEQGLQAGKSQAQKK